MSTPTVPDEGFRKGGVGRNAEPTKPLPNNLPMPPYEDPLSTEELNRIDGQWRGSWRNEVTGFAVQDIYRLLAALRRERAFVHEHGGGIITHNHDGTVFQDASEPAADSA